MTSKKIDDNLKKKLYQEWMNYPTLRDEFFNDFESFYHFREAEIKGLVKYLDVEKNLESLRIPPNKHLLIVKEFAFEIVGMYAGKAGLGKEGEVKTILRVILNKKKKLDFKTLLEIFDNDNLMEDIFSDYPDRIPMENINVKKEIERVEYYTESRGTKSISFSRLNSALSEIRKTLK